MTTLDELARMEPEDDDLEDYWRDLRPKQLVEVVRTKGSDLDGMLTTAAEKTIFDLAQAVNKKYDQKPVTGEMLADIVGTGIRIFMQKWRDALTNQNLTGLIEIVLEGQHLTPEEMLGFVQALPISILQRIADSAVGSGTGTHGLMSLEFIRRQGGIAYHLGVTNGRIWAEFAHPRTKETVQFFLDETFRLPNE